MDGNWSSRHSMNSIKKCEKVSQPFCSYVSLCRKSNCAGFYVIFSLPAIIRCFSSHTSAETDPTKGSEKRSLCGLFLGKFYSLLFVLVCCFGVYLCSFSQHARFGLICFDRCHCYYRIHHQKSRYVYDLFYRRKAISRGTIFFLLCKYTEQIKIMMSIL